MRPIRLELSAFGSFSEAVVIDFDDLAAYGLFHIHGSTGSGKTTLIDAMCFALYGRVTGNRPVDDVRSHHADTTTVTRVCLEFSLRNEDWRITRSPAYERAKRRGSGTTTQSAKATLERRGKGDWETVATGAIEVGHIVPTLLGLSVDQFRQVVVLPQGKFQEALRLSSEDRAALFRTLFGSEMFRRFTDELRHRSRQHMQQVEILAARFESVIAQIADRLAVEATEVSQEWLSEVEQRLAARYHELQQQLDTVSTEAQRCQSRIEIALAQEDQRSRRSQAIDMLRSCANRQSVVDDASKRLSDFQRCLPVLNNLDRHIELQEQLDQRRSTLLRKQRRTREHLRELSSHLDGEPTAISTVQQHLGNESEPACDVHTLTAASHELQRLAVRNETAIESAHRLKHIEQDLNRAIDTEAKLRDEQERIQGRVADTEATIHHLNQLTEETAHRASTVDYLVDRAERMHRLIEDHDALPDTQAMCRQAVEEHTEAVCVLDHRLAARVDMMERRLASIAAELAGALSEGEPCPVCGSCRHPHPAPGDPASFDDEVAQIEVEEARALVDHAATLRRHAEQRLHELEVRLGDNPRPSEAEAEEAAKELKEAEAAANALSQRRQLLEDARSSLIEVRAHLQSITAQLTDAVVEVNTLREKKSDCPTPDSLIDPAILAAAADGIDDVVGLTTDWNRLRDEVQGHEEDLRQAMSEIKVSSEDVEATRLTDDERRTLEQCISDHTSALAHALSIIEQTASVVAEPYCSTTELREHHGNLERTKAELIQEVTEVRVLRDDVTRLGAEHRAQAEGLAVARQEGMLLSQMADICTGTGNDKRMSLERYVLAAYMEEVCQAASERLCTMTGGRYRLEHSDELAGHGAGSGLAIAVHDAFTGRTRDVSTLSGGESFQSSLALALGMSDVVRRHSGGVQIDALFIDEGFGSLDDDALDDAMAELDQLREGGRLVGVISHVAALRSRIPIGIEVTKTPAGSTAKVVTAA